MTAAGSVPYTIYKVCAGIMSLFTQKHLYCLIRQFQNSILHTE